MELVQTIMLPISKVVPNKGQIDWLPKNPRRINTQQLQKLVNSIREYPNLLALRECLVYPFGDKYVLIGGNMRREACKRLGYTELPCKVIPPNTKPAEVRAYCLRDNAHFGDWDFSGGGFDFAELDLASVPLPSFDFKEEQRKVVQGAGPAWTSRKLKFGVGGEDKPASDESRCDLVARPYAGFSEGLTFLYTFKRTADGLPLSAIKAADTNVELFARAAEKHIRAVVQLRDISGWCLLTTPARRHASGSNFAEKVCARLSDIIGVPFLQGYAVAKNRNRLDPVFTPQFDISESNVILYDDIYTTGSTLRAMLSLLRQSRKNVLTVVGIYNHSI